MSNVPSSSGSSAAELKNTHAVARRLLLELRTLLVCSCFTALLCSGTEGCRSFSRSEPAAGSPLFLSSFPPTRSAWSAWTRQPLQRWWLRPSARRRTWAEPVRRWTPRPVPPACVAAAAARATCGRCDSFHLGPTSWAADTLRPVLLPLPPPTVSSARPRPWLRTAPSWRRAWSAS